MVCLRFMILNISCLYNFCINILYNLFQYFPGVHIFVTPKLTNMIEILKILPRYGAVWRKSPDVTVSTWNTLDGVFFSKTNNYDYQRKRAFIYRLT